MSLPSLEENAIKSLLYTADGSCTCFRMSIDVSKNLYTKYNIKSISITIPSDVMANQGCSLEQLPKIIEIALIDKSDNLDYNHPLCRNVICFDNCEDLMKDIHKLVNYSTPE